MPHQSIFCGLASEWNERGWRALRDGKDEQSSAISRVENLLWELAGYEWCDVCLEWYVADGLHSLVTQENGGVCLMYHCEL